MKSLVIICCALQALIQVSAFAQLDIAPTSVIISSATNTATMMIRNTDNEDREFELSSYFAYPATDESGNLFMNLDSTEHVKNSIVPYLKFFPRKLVIPAGSAQMVKFLFTPKGSMPEASYFSRLKIRTKPLPKPAESVYGKDSVAVKFNLELERVTGIVYLNTEQGKMSLEIGSPKTQKDSTLKLIVPMNATGNTPFWGKATIHVKDAEGTVIETKYELLAIYFSMNKKYDLDIAKYTPGKRYTLEINVTGDREEIPSELKETFTPIQKIVDFVMQ